MPRAVATIVPRDGPRTSDGLLRSAVMRALVIAAALLFAPALATARPTLAGQLTGELETALTDLGMDPDSKLGAPRFAFTVTTTHVAPKTGDAAREGADGESLRSKAPTLATSKDGTVAWLAVDIGEYGICGEGDCARRPAWGWYHATGLFEKAGATWQPVAWHIANAVTAKEQAAAMKKGVTLAPIPRAIAGAEAAVALFESTIGNAAALAKTVSSRKDVVLYGSELKERYVGGAAVAKTLAGWKLSFKVLDGVQAGITANKTVAWVAANVAASSPKRPTDKPTPYRVLAIYENVGGWKLVQLHFSFTSLSFTP